MVFGNEGLQGSLCSMRQVFPDGKASHSAPKSQERRGTTHHHHTNSDPCMSRGPSTVPGPGLPAPLVMPSTAIPGVGAGGPMTMPAIDGCTLLWTSPPSRIRFFLRRVSILWISQSCTQIVSDPFTQTKLVWLDESPASHRIFVPDASCTCNDKVRMEYR